MYQNFPQDCVTTDMTYDFDIKPIIDSKCVDCHGPGGNASGIPLTTYSEVMSKETSLLDRISRPSGSQGAMPPNGQLQKCSIDKINIYKFKKNNLYEKGWIKD